MVTALGLGANLGDRLGSLREAVRRVEAALRRKALARSDVFETMPWGVEDQPRFLNACVTVETDMPPLELLAIVKGIEREMGRVPGRRWGERIIDVDILLMGDRTIDEPGLRVPHAHLHEREFVLVPLSQILPTWRHPLIGRDVQDMARGAASADAPLRIAAL
ncbi:MAG: 2-amino-4-hydroxy-6-hydroxymethyldihydropteridine diphosphokinase [Synergistaceae bacterium]|nr:2-amino-4-hydroxy-6-hydroxymethyldihydropteridine diphosphokinase [Synergistaceae bacterium]